MNLTATRTVPPLGTPGNNMKQRSAQTFNGDRKPQPPSLLGPYPRVERLVGLCSRHRDRTSCSHSRPPAPLLARPVLRVCSLPGELQILCPCHRWHLKTCLRLAWKPVQSADCVALLTQNQEGAVRPVDGHLIYCLFLKSILTYDDISNIHTFKYEISKF